MHLVAAVCCLSLAGFAQNLRIQRISNPGTVNSDPAISETGLAAWMYMDTNVAETAFSHIGLFVDGEYRDLTAEAVASMYGAAKPTVQSNSLVFLANYQEFRSESVTWVLREVATRDEGEYRELDARYKATVDDSGNQRLIPINPTSTNTPPESEDEDDERLGARRQPSGEAEVWYWSSDGTSLSRVTHDMRNDYASSIWGDVIAWQKAKGWPFGWEIMAMVGDTRLQLTTNFYYDMGPKVHGSKIVWYGWDGFDYEIYMNDTVAGTTVQITSNRYDDVAPQVFNDVIVWEGYPAVESDIYMWKDGETRKISTNIDDDLLPRIWDNWIVWQGFDGDDFEIYVYDIERGEVTQITRNRYDDTNPEISGDLLVWMGYEGNWDAEIFYVETSGLRSGNINPVQLTDNEDDDREPKTGGRKIIWVAEEQGETSIMLAE